MTNVLKDREGKETEIQGRRPCDDGAETGVTCLQAKSAWSHQELEKEGSSLEPPEGAGPADILI